MYFPDSLKRIPIAHRGLHGEGIPENSLAAFQAAIAHGYAIETDVRFTKDKQIVLFHDDELSRMTETKRNVCDCTLEELKALRLKGTDERIPLLPELLELAGTHTPLLIEIKPAFNLPREEVVAALASAMKSFEGTYAIQSFHPLYVKAYKKLCPEVACGVLGEAHMGGIPKTLKWRFYRHVIKRLSFNFYVKPDFISYCFTDLPRRKVSKFKGGRLAWVARSREEELRARRYADNVIFERYLPEIPPSKSER